MDGGTYDLYSNMDCGTVTIQSAARTITDRSMTFKTPFKIVPKVIVSIESTTSNADYGYITALTMNISEKGFTIRIANACNSNFTPAINWIALAK